MELLKLNDVTIKYQNFVAVSNVSFTACSGDYFCIVGCNGGGKTSLVKAILGLIPLASGNISVEVDRADISYLPQVSAISTTFPAKNSEVIMSGRQMRGRGIPFFRQEDRDIVGKVMSEMGIEDIASKSFSALSGGQRQAVLLARSLVSQPKILILDEPSNSLDEHASQKIYKILRNKCDEGLCVIMVSHDLVGVKQYASKVAVIETSMEFCGDLQAWEQYRNAGEGAHYDT